MRIVTVLCIFIIILNHRRKSEDNNHTYHDDIDNVDYLKYWKNIRRR